MRTPVWQRHSIVEGNSEPMCNEHSVTCHSCESREPESYADLVAALIIRPHERAWDSVRASWLFQMADALQIAGYHADAGRSRELAMTLVRSAILTVAKG